MARLKSIKVVYDFPYLNCLIFIPSAARNELISHQMQSFLDLKIIIIARCTTRRRKDAI